MNYIKKIIFFITQSSIYLVVFLTLAIFLYSAFFFDMPIPEKQITENKIIINEESSEQEEENKLKEEPKLESKLLEEQKEISELEEQTSDILQSKNIIKDSLFATVGNKAITRSDIINEIKIILILNGQVFSEEIKEQLEAGAIQSTIRRKIKQIEIEKYKSLEFNRPDLEKELKAFADNLSMDLYTFENTFIANGIAFSNITDQIKTELLWNSLIFEIYKNRLTINLDEIDEQLKAIQDKEEIEEYLLSEIIIPSVSKDELESKIKELKNKIKVEGFDKVAINLSISESAFKGGNLNWVSENIISEKFKSAIRNTPVGNISEPILLAEGILIFKVRDKRKVKRFENLEMAKNQLVNAEKTKILRMHSSSHYDNLRKSISLKYF